MENLYTELLLVVLNNIPTKNVVIYSRVCKRYNTIVKSLQPIFWISRIKNIDHSLFFNLNHNLIRVTSIVELGNRSDLLDVRDLSAIPIAKAMFSLHGLIITPIDAIKCDNEILLRYLIESQYLDENANKISYESRVNSCVSYFSVKCFVLMRSYANAESIRKAIRIHVRDPPTWLPFLQSAYTDIKTCAYELAGLFQEFYRESQDVILLWLLNYQSLLLCTDWEFVSLLLVCALNTDMWNSLMKLNTARSINVKEILVNKKEEWNLVGCKIRNRYNSIVLNSTNMKVPLERLEPWIDNVSVYLLVA